MSIAQEILQEIGNQTLYYKGVPVSIFGIPKFKHISRTTMSQTLYRLNQKNYIEKKQSGYVITTGGKKYIAQKMKELKQFDTPKIRSKEKILLVFFDIPQEKKKYREWFRMHLKRFDYEMIQQSVWVGPDPLPTEFTDYIKEIGLDHCIETIKLAKPYKSKKAPSSYFAKIRNMI